VIPSRGNNAPGRGGAGGNDGEDDGRLNGPALAKPMRDQISGGRPQNPAKPGARANDVNVIPSIDKPGRPQGNANNLDDRSHDLGGAKPGEFLIKPARDDTGGARKQTGKANDPQVLNEFKPGSLRPRGSNDLSARANDPMSVSGMRNRDVVGGKADGRRVVIPGQKQSVMVDRQVVVKNNVIVASSCGHSFCSGHNGCVFHTGFCSPCGWGCGSGFSFSFGWCNSSFGVTFGTNWCGGSCFHPCNWWCGPSWCWRPYWYWSPYYYGAYYPYYASYYYPYSGNYWWLYDNGSSYNNGYSNGYSQGYDAGAQSGSDMVGGYDSTWLAGGSDSSGGSMFRDSTTAPTAPPQIPAAQAGARHDGWDFLASGDVHEARRIFERDKTANPEDGLPEIGYAIAAGLLERYDEALASMRAAVRDDPDAFGETPHDAKTDERINALLTHYRNATREKSDDADALFMTAALRHLLGQDALGLYAIDKAMQSGDHDPSALVLKGVIQRSLDAQPQSAPPAVPDLQQPPSSVPGPVSAPTSVPTTSPAGYTPM
jgi:tetratricopeptide (TPR) repeat protein